VEGVGTLGAAAADRSTGCTYRSGWATGSFGLERGQCWRSTTRFFRY
jgi:hypothetical protein